MSLQFPRFIQRKVDDRINPFMPPRALNLFGEADEDAQMVGTGGAFGENANVIANVAVLVGGIAGSMLLFKGQVVTGLLMMGGAAAFGAVVDTATHPARA